MKNILITDPKKRNFRAAGWAGFWGGNISSFVKWGTEIPFPPRVPGRPIPPAEMIRDMGFNVDAMVYTFSERVINWGVAGVHHIFSIFFAMLYCYIAEVMPQVKLWQSVAFAIVLTIGFHGVLLPINGWGPHMWELPLDEIMSELFGHIVWMWTIEIFRRDIRNRITNQPDPEC